MTTLAPLVPRATTRPNEGMYRQAVVDAARLFGWSCFWTWNSKHSPAGWPDLVLLRPPRALFRELKVAPRKPTRAQRAALDWLSACGLDAGVWSLPDDWERIVEALR